MHGLDQRGLCVQAHLEKHWTGSVLPLCLDEFDEGILGDWLFKPTRERRHCTDDFDAVDLLDSPLANRTVSEVRRLHLAAEDKQLPVFEEGTRESGHRVRQTRPSRKENVCTFAIRDLVEVFGGDRRRHLMRER